MCEPLIKQGLVRTVERRNRVGRPRTPLPVDESVSVPEDSMVSVDRDDDKRRAHLEGKGVKCIAR